MTNNQTDKKMPKIQSKIKAGRRLTGLRIKKLPAAIVQCPAGHDCG